jgi:hypothetical protein
MNVELPSAPGYAGAFVRGWRSVGNTSAIEQAAGVVVRRGFTIVDGAFHADARARAEIAMGDTIVLDSDNVAWVSYESEAALAKFYGDVIVIGARDAERGGWVSFGINERIRRPAGAAPPRDDDLRRNLFGFHPRAEISRSNDARTLPQTPNAAPAPLPGDRLDRFSNAQRRDGVGGVIVSPGPIPVTGEVTVTQGPSASDPQSRTVAQATYDLTPPRVTLFLHHGSGPDRAPRWCPHDQGAMTLDTLVLEPDAGMASALWRLSWRWADIGADSLRRIVVSGGAA